ncbi:pyruvate ferredoxin oxidoreductase [Candidatus Falkowbacteria bacterium CG10_big_fil_rev_8_21_14_0_10_43_11]|uniref:Pyruvate ferredoxin oxidoreductase n=1 Tax=Candidatus Falkowbacteria bacterium CG10_big_fil_rev_8_21_14_0_10_43_11 TaxID=1974568 RepID=A0A2M6WML6_9BACT|nr:MAG: pyruvate ferredoxin oxidoreductase [Candidatus Falkowbacteria bacterium CG10_big_fil_rev_8_21_14_0_10_43_11]
MSVKNTNQITTVLFGGAAGDGIKEAGISLGKLFCKAGQEVFISSDYPSLIRGGHNFCRVSFAPEKVANDRSELDIAVAFNEETAKLHQGELKKAGILILDGDKKNAGKIFYLPMSELVKKAGAPSMIMRTAVALGALCYYFFCPLKDLEKIFTAAFKDKAAKNILLARQGFKHAAENNWPALKIPVSKKSAKRLIDGNQAFAEGFVDAGLEAYIAYPMTPATSILHFLASNKSKFNIRVVQPENEIAAATMALGAAYAGKRTAVGTSGGGFALMQEAFSLAGITEIPFVAAISQRPGPATGVPTGTAQADLAMLKNAGHGEFPLVVLAPGDADESYEAGREALNLAWQFQIPVLVLLDKHLSESIVTADFKNNKKIIKGNVLTKVNKPSRPAGRESKEYKRYQFSASGISPLAFPGTKNAAVKVNSYEHDEFGIMTEDKALVKKMVGKRFKKMPLIAREVKKYQPLKIYGDKRAPNAVIFWGSTKGAVLEAVKIISQPIKAIQVFCLEPFPSAALARELRQAKKIIAVEGNVTGQLAALIREKTGIEIKHKILQYDSKPFNPMELAKKLNKLL